MAMTTNSSMSVNPCFDLIRFMRHVSLEWNAKRWAQMRQLLMSAFMFDACR